MSGIEQSASDEGNVRGRAKRSATAIPPPTLNLASATPSTFFLRTEREMEKSLQSRGRKPSLESPDTPGSDAPTGVNLGDSTFGVQSLEDTINSTFARSPSLSRVDSYGSELGSDASGEAPLVAGKKRKAGNPVHPKIAATGQRILSSEYTHPCATASPTSYRSADSPLRLQMRRDSTASFNCSQPVSPLRMSPHPGSLRTSTPRSSSVKSFRSSGDDSSVVGENNRQVFESSVTHEEDLSSTAEVNAGSLPQLVMPSIAIPSRRPFTEKGKRMGRLKVMVVGPQRVGKTSLIQSMFRCCEDVVHVDPPARMTGLKETSPDDGNDSGCSHFMENTASTRPYPSWWTDMESRRMLLRRKSMGDGVLERNLCLIDTPDINTTKATRQVSNMITDKMRNIASLESMNDSELITLLSGEGSVGIDALLWVFDPSLIAESDGFHISDDQKQLFQESCRLTNVIPVIGRADAVDAASLSHCKTQILSWLKDCSEDTFSFYSNKHGVARAEAPDGTPQEPFAVSSAVGSDAETIDASVLMSSQYMAPLYPSELAHLTGLLLDPDNMSRMRHLAATKFLLWRQENLGAHINLHKQAILRSPRFSYDSPAITSTRSAMEHDSSKVLVPYGSSSYFRSASPSVSEVSSLPADAIGTSAYTLDPHDEQGREQPYRQVRLAKWAQDLQRSLGNERRRYQQMYFNSRADWTSDDGEKSDQALITARDAQRPARGRLGGDIAVIDPRDPLGVLAFTQAFRRSGFFALQLAGGVGLVGAVAFWVLRNWAEVQDFLGLGQAGVVTSVPAVPPPNRGLFDEMDWRAFFGWRR